MVWHSPVQAQDYEEVTIRELNTYDETPQTTDDFADHPMVGEQVEFEAIVISSPRSSGLANFTEEEDPDEVGIGRIHFFVVDRNALEEGREGMYMQVVASDVGDFETLERGDLVNMRGTHEFFSNTVQFDPDEAGFIGNVLSSEALADYRELLEPWEISMDEINMEAEDGTYTFNPEGYEKYINAYVRFEETEVIGSDLEDSGRPNFYWVDENGIPAWIRDVSLRYRNDRNDVEGGYRDGYNYRRVEEQAGFEPDGVFQPPSSGTIINVSGFVVWDNFDPYDLNESDELSTLQIAAMEDGVLWWGTGDNVERRTTDPNNSDYDWPNDLEEIGFPPSISNYSISNTQPGPGEQVEISADIQGPDGEEVYDVQVSYETSEGNEGSADMDENNGSYSYEFDEFGAFETVTFTISATVDAEDEQGNVVSITGRFSDGDTDDAGNVLDMKFTQMGDAITEISTIQRTTDSRRGHSPLIDLDLGDVDIEIDAVVVSDHESGFVVIHDAAEEWSGVPISASSPGVEDLERGEQITITDAVISAPTDDDGDYFDETYLDEIEYTSGGVLDDLINELLDYLPTLTVSEATANNGAAYEGMVIRLQDVVAETNQADDPSDFGEWAIAQQDDADGPTLRINDFPDFGEVTGDFSTTVPGDLNANIRIGAEFDEVYGFSAYSFGNPKIHLRDLDDLVTDESYTWPVRELSLHAIGNPERDETGNGSAPDTVIVDEGNVATWETSTSYDGGDVNYRFVLQANGNNFDDPLIETEEYEVDGDTVSVQLSASELQQAFDDAGYDEEDTGEFQWTVFLSNEGEGEVQVSDKDGAEFIPTYTEVTAGYADVIVSSEDHEVDVPQTVELNQNYPNPFNPTTNIEYQIPERSDVQLTVYDVLGREVSVLVNEEQSSGTYTVEFDGSQLSSGMYIYRLEAGDTSITQQMMLVK